jgi:hypothetical protein
MAELYFCVTPRQRVLGRIFSAVTGIIFVLFVVRAVFAPAPHIGTGSTILGASIATIGGVLSVTYIERGIVNPSVRATVSGLYIYNGLRTHVVAWVEVAGFQRSSRPFQMAVRRTHGRPIAMAGVTNDNLGYRSSQRAKIGELEVYWRRIRAAEPDGWPERQACGIDA